MTERQAVLHNLTNHTPSPEGIASIERLRAKAKAFSLAMLKECPNSPDRDIALKSNESTLMWANASIARKLEYTPDARKKETSTKE